MMNHRTVIAAFTSLALATSALAQEDSVKNILTDESARNFKAKSYSPYVGRNFPTRPLWGDTHLHTNASLDAFGAGARLNAEQAYRFARGEVVRMESGMEVRLSRPLDWLVIADHAEFAGIMPEISAGNPTLMVDERNRRWNKLVNQGGDNAWQAVIEIVDALGQKNLPPSHLDPKLAKSVWLKHLEITDR